jgi:hypothetical protein
MISSATSWTNASATRWLSQQFQTAGLSAGKAATAATDVLHAAEASLSTEPNESDGDFRAALDKQIEQDVSTGTLTRDDATKLKKALDQVTGTSDSADAGATDAGETVAAAAGPSGGRGAAGGGGAGSSEKTEVSRLTTVSGNTKTTIITYSDGSNETDTATATKADRQKFAKQQAEPSVSSGTGSDATTMAMDYLAQLPRGSFVNKNA